MDHPLKGIAFYFAALLVASSTSAATMFENQANCGTADNTLVGGQNAADCNGYFEKSGAGNPNPNEENVNGLGLFGYSDWIEIDNATVSSDPTQNPTSWVYGGDLSAFDQVIFAFKQANGFSAYLFENTALDFSSGTWVGLPSSINPGISHIQILGRVSEVPLPTAAWLFLSALGGLGIIKRKRH